MVSIATIAYSAGAPPNDPKDLPRYLREELNKLQGVIVLLAAGHLDQTHVAPKKPRDGDIRYADGTNWNPGGGKGVYAYNGTTWNQIVAM
jgi:hypothetical protein